MNHSPEPLALESGNPNPPRPTALPRLWPWLRLTLLALAFCVFFSGRSQAQTPVWIEGHWDPAWVPPHNETQWQDGYWQDQWVSGYWTFNWVDGYWENHWVSGYWSNYWVDGYWNNQWTDGHWEDHWNDGYWNADWVNGYWDSRWVDGYYDDWGNWNDGYWESYWVDGYWNWYYVNGYWSSDWVDGYWTSNWVDGYWASYWVDGYWDSNWVPGYWNRVWVDGHWESVWINGQWITVTIPGYWEPHGTWVEGHWEPPLVWTPFDDITSGWYVLKDWNPDSSTVPIGQIFTQARTLGRNHKTGERNQLGWEQNISYPVETQSESRSATGTAKLNQAPVYGGDASIIIGQGFDGVSAASGGSGSGGFQWCVAGYTNWGTGSWSAPSTGTYEFWVRRLGDGTYNDSTPAGPYHLTVSAPVGYAFSVVNGSGGGTYTSGTSVPVAANSPSYGQVFDHWTQSGAGSLADPNWHQTNYTMGSGAATITAYYRTVNFNWGNTPSSAAVGVTYNVNVGVDSGGMPYVTLYKNGAYFAAGWFGAQGDASHSSAQTVNYDANFSDTMKPSSGASSRQVQIYVPVTYMLTTASSPSAGGSIGLSANGPYTSGTSVTLTANASAGYGFTGWTGALSGTSNPATLVMDAHKSVTANFGLVPVVTSPTTASGSVNAGFSYQVTAANNPTGFSVTGTLPPGLNANGGVISGTPTTVGSWSVTMKASNGAGWSAGVGLTINIAAANVPVITSPSSASGVVGTAFNYQITATNNPTSYVVTGTLPDGVNVNGGTISGTSTTGGTWTLTLRADNAAGQGTPASLTITIAAVPIITSPATATGMVAVPFSYQITATNNPTSFNVSGTLPAGLTVNASGRISGTPTTVGTQSVTIRASNTAEPGLDAPLTITIGGPIDLQVHRP